MYDTTCMTHNRFSNFHCVYTIIQVVHTEFIKVITESAFKSSSKMIQEQAAAAVIIALISEKNKSRKKRKRKKSLCETLAWENLESYETLLAELRLEDEYNYKILLRMTSENFEEIFQLIKDDIAKENTKMRELIPSRL